MIKKKSPVLLSMAYLPPIVWFAIAARHEVWLEAHETYPKQTFRNRCEIYAEKGRMALSIPVNRPQGNRTQVGEVQIFNDEKWYLRHWRAVQSAYEASPYFLYYKDDLADFYCGRHTNLFDFNWQLIQILAKLLEIDLHLKKTKNFQHEPENGLDFREMIHPKKNLEGFSFPAYIQVFSDRHGFIPNLSILDLLFNMGPESKTYLKQVRLPFN
jgi:hypothetical protein